MAERVPIRAAQVLPALAVQLLGRARMRQAFSAGSGTCPGIAGGEIAGGLDELRQLLPEPVIAAFATAASCDSAWAASTRWERIAIGLLQGRRELAGVW